MSLRSSIPLLLAIAAACSHERPGASEASLVPADAFAVASEPIDNPLESWRSYSGIDRRQRLVIRDQQAWEDFWRRATSNTSPSQPAPTIDFDRDIVVIAAMGSRPTGGYAIAIDGLFQQANDLYAVVLETSPGPSCGTTQAVTAPLAAARVRRVTGEVIFVERQATRDCD